MAEFIVTKVSELDLSSESMAETLLTEDVVCKAARSLGLRVKKVHRRISLEEFHERWSKLRLCMFCGEQETPYHHLQHKNEVILMIECDDDQKVILMIECVDDQIFEDKEETHQVHETLTNPAPIEEDVSSDRICDEKELVSIDLDLQEVQPKTVAEEKLNLPNGQNTEHLVGKNLETFSAEYSSFLNLSSSNGYQRDSTWIEPSLYLLCSLKDGRVWEPGGLPTKMNHWDWLEKELKPYGESHKVATFLYSQMLVVRDQTQEVRSDVVYSPWVSVKRDGAVETQACNSIRANHVWKPGGFVHPKIQLDWLERADSTHEEKQAWIENAWFKIHVFSDFDIASWVGLEIYGCETKKQTLLVVKLANRVWERGKLLATHLYWKLFGLRAVIWLGIRSWKPKKQVNIGHISLNGMCNKLVYDEEKKKLRHVGDDVTKGKNSFLRDVKIILALAVKECRMGKAAERLLPGHYGMLHTFDQCGGLNATVIAGTIMQSSLKLFHRLRVACLHHTSLGFLYGSLPRPPDENHSNFSNMLQYHETWSCISLQTNRDGNPVIEKLVKEEFPEVFLEPNELPPFRTHHDHKIKLLKFHLRRTQHCMNLLAVQHRIEREFAIGDCVYVKLQPYRHNSVVMKGNQKLAPKFYDPYKVIDCCGEAAYKLQLPASSQIHYILHVSQLRVLVENVPPVTHLPSVLADVLVKRQGKAVTKVLVKWKNEPVEEATWEFLFDLQKKLPELSLNLEVKVVWRGKM